MNIELYEGQECHLYITLNDEFEVYGGTTKQQFTVTRVNDEYLVTIPGQTNSMCYDSRFDIFARRASTGQEWLVQSGKIILKSRRSPEPATALSCFEYHITKTLVESGESYGVMVMGVKGEKGDMFSYTVSELASIQELQNNTIYRAGELSSLEIILPEEIPADFIAQVDFSSGSTATKLTCSEAIVWTGNDVTSGMLVPKANMRYSCLLYFDGLVVRGIVCSIANPVSE